MTAANSLPGASSIGLTQWDFLPWQTIEKQVKRLQMRIAKADCRTVTGRSYPRLERSEGKLSRCVLMGGGTRNGSSLPDSFIGRNQF